MKRGCRLMWKGRLYASFSQFFMKLFFAAPFSGLPLLSTAFGSQRPSCILEEALFCRSGLRLSLRTHATRRERARAIIERWNYELTKPEPPLPSPSIRTALIAGMPWLEVLCPACATARFPSSWPLMPENPQYFVVGAEAASSRAAASRHCRYKGVPG